MLFQTVGLCLILTVVPSLAAAPFDCNAVPIALRCQSEELAKECGYSEACNNYFNATEGKPLKVTLLYESLCPDCQEFITGDFYKAYLKFMDHVEFELVPYGNARIENGKIICQHGEKECAANKYEGCILHYMKEPLPFLACLEHQIPLRDDLDKAIQKCYNTFKPAPHVIDQVIHCANGEIGNKLQLEAAARTAQVYPDAHKHVPWLLFNNVSLADSQFFTEQFEAAICTLHNGQKPLPQCTGAGVRLGCPVDLSAEKNGYFRFSPDAKIADEPLKH
uniref:Saposin A-type domain-containing protein n=1 Tax=Panagrellus redivivus TaxID=6233 RepID=A0A7E4WD94_PANRE